MSINYKATINEVYAEFQDNFTPSEIDDLLGIKDTFDTDNPMATGKRLIINSVHVIGNKNSQPFEESFDYKEGVNILIADNLKGKSSIFKVIKYALTGSNSLRKDVKGWLDYAFVNFNISSKSYTVFLDLTRWSVKSILLNGHITNVDEIDNQKASIIFQTKGENDFEEEIGRFFFKQFSYYSLKWTQKSSSKQSIDLVEAGTSWKTYFKSILLESKDSVALMYGSQGTKVFEMLLGVHLTYPLNRLSVKKDMLEHEKARSVDFKNNISSTSDDKKQSIQGRIDKINQELEEINSDYGIQKFNTINNEIQILRTNIASHHRVTSTLDLEIKKIKDEHIALIKSHSSIKEDKERIEKEITKAQKQKNDLEEFIAIGAFFSNLEITHCPACDHTLSHSHKQQSGQEHTCSLCHEDVSDKEVDTENHQNKIDELKTLLVNLNSQLQQKYEELGSLSIEIENKKKDIASKELKKSALPDVAADNNNLISLQSELSNLNNNANDSERIKLLEERGALQFQLQNTKENSSVNTEDVDLKISLIKLVIEKLKATRVSLGQNILDKFSELLLIEIQTLGLTSIAQVTVDENFNIKFKQGNEFIRFGDISEGEQLRVKIAFYLSLIQMDITSNLSRHTRLLMIDSPAKEEADNKYLEGLSELLTTIEKRFGDELQILVATAERGLENVLSKQTIIPPDESVF